MGNRVLLVIVLAAVALLAFVALRSGREAPPVGPRAAPEAPSEAASPAPGVLPPIPDLPESPTGSGSATLTVIVVDEANAPVEGARVTVAGRAALTGEDGTTRIEGLPEGTKVPVRATAGRTAIPATGTVDLVPDRDSDLKLVLKAGGGITGTVLGKGGAPLAEPYTVFVTLDTGQRSGGPFVGGGREVARQQFPAGTTSFSIDGVPAGTCIARASAEGYVEKSSEPFEVTQGAITDGVVIQLEPGGRITGLVTRALTGEPVPDATVAVQGGGGAGQVFVTGGRGTNIRMMGGKSAKTNAQGTFAIDGLSPGSYALEASAKDLASGRSEGIEVREAGEAGGILITLGEGGTLTGRVYGSDGQPVPGAEVLIGRVQRGLSIQGDFGDRVEANDDGVYTVEHLDPGWYRVSRPRSTRGTTVAFAMSTVVIGGREPPKEEEMEAPPGTVTIREGQVTRFDVMDPRSSAVRGKVVDDAGRPHRGQVELRPIEAEDDQAAPGPRFSLPLIGMPDEEGRFEFREVKPGRYTIACAGTEQEVAVVEGESAEVVLRVAPAKVEGVVLTAAGEPVSGANVMLEPIGETARVPRNFSFTGWEMTDKDGKFNLSGMAAGRYRAMARTGRSEGRSGEFSVGPGESVSGLSITIEEMVEIRVEVRDASGNPVAFAPVALRQAESSVSFGGRAGRTDKDGIARISAPPGEWTITVLKMAEPPQRAEQRVTITSSPGQSFAVTL
jgi:protocatechuate 3,4-dioxygenase beta subunit